MKIYDIMTAMNENVIKLRYEDKDIYLIKTAHVSKNSVEDVKETIEEIGPDAICIELDEDRYGRIKKKKEWTEMDIKTVIKGGKVGFLLVNMILASFQRRVATKLGSNTGGEMLEGMKQAEERSIPLILADRDINTTFKRIWYNLGFTEKCKLLATIIYSIFDDEEITEEDLANLKSSDMLDAAMNDIAKSFPNVKRILVDERDMYLAYKIRSAKGQKVVAIVGAAHADGIASHITEDIDIEALCDLTKHKSVLGTIIKWGIPLALVAIVIYSFIANRDVGIDQVITWILFCGIGSALGSIIALAHPLTILVSFIVAPFTAINPLLAAGWFAGLTEISVRKPKVRDFEGLAEDTSTLKGFFKNRITRVLLVVVSCNIFCSIGSIIGGIDVVRSFLGLL